MTSRDFCFWLQGYFEISGSGSLSVEQAEVVRKHLALVFVHELDPSMGPPAHQVTSCKAHQDCVDHPELGAACAELPLTIARSTLQAVFDTAVNSMDFGSGFLDDDDVVELRKVAVVLGVPTETATPRPMLCKYEYSNVHVFGAPKNPGWCTRCGSWQKDAAAQRQGQGER